MLLIFTSNDVDDVMLVLVRVFHAHTNMTNLLVSFIVLITIITTQVVLVEPIVCFLCDNNASFYTCSGEDRSVARCDGIYCSVTSYVRSTYDGCQLSI